MINPKSVFSTQMSGIMLCPGRHKTFTAGKIPKFGDQSLQWVGKGKAKEQKQRK